MGFGRESETDEDTAADLGVFVSVVISIRCAALPEKVICYSYTTQGYPEYFADARGNEAHRIVPASLVLSSVRSQKGRSRLPSAIRMLTLDGLKWISGVLIMSQFSLSGKPRCLLSAPVLCF